MMKKIISALMSLSLLTGVAAMPVSAAETYSLGDVDMDGVVSSADALMTLQMYSYGTVLGQDLSQLFDNIETILPLANVRADESGSDSIPDLTDAVTILEYFTLNTLMQFDLLTMDYFVETYDEYRENGTSFYADKTSTIIEIIPEDAEAVSIDGFGTLSAAVGDYRMTRYTVYHGTLRLEYIDPAGYHAYITLSPTTEETIAKRNAKFDADSSYSTIDLMDLQAHYHPDCIRWDQSGYWVDVIIHSNIHGNTTDYDDLMTFSTIICEMIEAM